MIKRKNCRHKPWRTFFTANSLPFISAIVIYLGSKIFLENDDQGGALILTFILIVLSLIPSLIFALAVSLRFKPTDFSPNSNASIWASMNTITALLVGFFSSGLTDMQGWFSNGTAWIVLLYCLVGFCVGRYLTQSKATTDEGRNRSTQNISDKPIQQANSSNQVIQAAPSKKFWKSTLGFSISNFCILFILVFFSGSRSIAFLSIYLIPVVLFIQFGFIIYLLCEKCFKQAAILTVSFIIFVLALYSFIILLASIY